MNNFCAAIFCDQIFITLKYYKKQFVCGNDDTSFKLAAYTIKNIFP